VTDPSLGALEAQRERLYEQLAVTGDFRRGSVSENYRRCGNSPAYSLKHARTPRAGQRETPTHPVTWAPSPPPRSSPPRYTPKHRAGAPSTSANSSSWAMERTGSANLATPILPEATQIVDLYHAREHLHDLAKLLAPALGDNQPAWLQARLEDLWRRRHPNPRPHRPNRCHCPTPTTSPNATQPWATSQPTPSGCATPNSASWACSSALAPSKPAAKPSSANA
jgi:hypothetical protein